MKRNHPHSFAGLCAILTGAFTALAGVLYFLLPARQRLGVAGAEILPSFAGNPFVLKLENLALGLVGVFGLGILPAITRLLKAEHDGWLRWTGSLAATGYAVSVEGIIPC